MGIIIWKKRTLFKSKESLQSTIPIKEIIERKRLNSMYFEWSTCCYCFYFHNLQLEFLHNTYKTFTNKSANSLIFEIIIILKSDLLVIFFVSLSWIYNLSILGIRCTSFDAFSVFLKARWLAVEEPQIILIWEWRMVKLSFSWFRTKKTCTCWRVRALQRKNTMSITRLFRNPVFGGIRWIWDKRMDVWSKSAFI